MVGIANALHTAAMTAVYALVTGRLKDGLMRRLVADDGEEIADFGLCLGNVRSV